MSMRRVGVLLAKELRHGSKSFIFIFATAVPIALSVVLLVVFGQPAGSLPRLGVLDQGDSQLASRFGAQPYVDLQVYESEAELRRDVERGALDVGVIVPPAFDAAARDRTPTVLTVLAWGEALVRDRAALAVALASNVGEIGGMESLVTVEPVVLGDHEIESWAERLLPLVILMTILLGGMLVPAVSLVDEKEKRTLQAVTATRASLVEVLTAKALVGIAVSLTMGAVILALNRVLTGSPALLVAALGLAGIAAALLGLMLGALSRDFTTLFAIVKPLGIVLYAPALVELVPQLPAWLARLFPTYYLIAPIEGLTVDGAGAGEVVAQLAVLALLTAVLLIALAAVVHRQQARQVLPV